jgi:competence protein ComEC
LWLCVALGHALAWRAPVPARLHDQALVAALATGAASLLIAWLAARRAPGIRRRALERIEAALGAVALIAAGTALGAEADASSPPLAVHPAPVRVRLEGRVLDTTALEAIPPTILFEATRVLVGESESPCRARVALRFRDEAGVPRWAYPGLALSVAGEYRPPEDARNPGVEAPGRWMERLGVSGSVEVDPAGVAAGSDPRERGAAATWVWRDRIARAFDEHLAPPVAALSRGMILGDRSMIAPAMRDAFRDGGTIHILSISGLHVCILGGFAALGAAAFRLSLLPSLAFELLAVWGYTLLVGAPASALRAALLWTAVRGGRAAGREVRPFAAWGLAGLLLHLADPRAVHDPGFQLSFAAVLGLLAVGGLGGDAASGGGGPLGVARTWLRGGAAIALQSAGATAGTIGISARLFGALPVAGFFLNIAVVPLCGVVMAESFLFLAAIAVPVSWLRDAAAGALDGSSLLMLWANDWGARLVSPWPIHHAPTPAVIAASMALLLLGAALRETSRHEPARIARRMRRAALASVAIAGVVPLVPLPRRDAGPPVVIAIDVGQGDALLARSEDGRVLLVDAGPADESRDQGRMAVEPLLRAEGIVRVDHALLSHAHRDHFGGLAWLARRGWIASLLENGSDSGGAWRRALEGGLRRHAATLGAVTRDTLIGTGTSTLRIWAPPADSVTRARGNAVENNRSLVGTLTLGAARVFLPGDAEDEAERAQLSRVSPVEILKSPHHGSRTSSTAEWVEMLRPRIVLVSCGERNRFGHPSRATMGRYRLTGARVWRTDREGAVRVTVVDGGAWVSTRAHPEPEWVPLGDSASAPLGAARSR